MIKYIAPIVIYNLVRLSFLKLVTSGKLCFALVQRISPNAKLSIKSDGQIVLKGSCTVKNGTLIQAIGGEIAFEGYAFINRNCTIVSMDSITVGAGTTIGPNVCIYDHDHNYKTHSKEDAKFKTSPITIGQNVWIGAGTIILRGTVIGDNSVVGAGTIVKGIIPPNYIVKSNRELIIEKI